MTKKILLGFLIAIALGACSSEEGEQDNTIVLTGGTQTSQIIYADETQKNEGIKFTAAKPWTATVAEVKTRTDGESSVDWLKLSAYSGGAGDFTLNLTLTPNTTGKSRKAEIRIVAGETVMTISVEQKVETESGAGILKAIKKISSKTVFNSEKDMGSSRYITEDSRVFSYDERGRVARIAWEEKGNTGTMTFDYTIAGEITIKEKEGEYEDTYIAKLNEKGNAVSLQNDDKNVGTFKDYIRFSYTNDGRLAQWKDADAGNEASSTTFSYTNGLLAKMDYISGKYPDESQTINVDVSKAYVNRYPNNGSVDIISFFEDDDDYNFLYYIGRLSKTSDYLPEVFPDVYNYNEESPKEQEFYTTPGVVIEKLYNSIQYPGGDLIINYTFDADKCLTGIKTERKYSLMQTTYKVTVSNELIDPEFPERGYTYSTSTPKTVKVKDSTDSFNWTIEY